MFSIRFRIAREAGIDDPQRYQRNCQDTLSLRLHLKCSTGVWCARLVVFQPLSISWSKRLLRVIVLQLLVKPLKEKRSCGNCKQNLSIQSSILSHQLRFVCPLRKYCPRWSGYQGRRSGSVRDHFAVRLFVAIHKIAILSWLTMEQSRAGHVVAIRYDSGWSWYARDACANFSHLRISGKDVASHGWSLWATRGLALVTY